MDTIEEGDSFLCYSEDSSINDDPFDPHERRKKAVEMALGLGGLAAFFFFIFEILAAISYFLIKKKRLTVRRKREGLTCRVQTSRVPSSRLSLAEIRLATMGFDRKRIVGEGASATVYKGFLPSGGEVAIKRFERANGIDCVRNPFTTEWWVVYGTRTWFSFKDGAVKILS